MFSLKRELDSTELIKWIAAIIGACIAFYLVSLQEIKNDQTRLSIEKAKAKKEAVESLALYRPRLGIHYTNRLSEDGEYLMVRVFLESRSALEVYIGVPELRLFDEAGRTIASDAYESVDIGSFQGFISPKIPFNISYKIALSSAAAQAATSIRLDYLVETDALMAKAMRDYLQHFGDEQIDELAARTTSKNFIYQENIYPFGENDIWDDFWTNPR